MSFRKTVAIATLTLASIVPAVAMAQPQHRECTLSSHHITSVSPYKPEIRYGRQAYPELRGAVVHVQAEKGLTAEWLRLEINRHLATMQGTAMPGCALDQKGITVSVESSGAGFDVKIAAPNAKQGEEVLRRARLLA